MNQSAMPSPKNFFPCPLMRNVSTDENVSVLSALRLHSAPFLLYQTGGTGRHIVRTVSGRERNNSWSRGGTAAATGGIRT